MRERSCLVGGGGEGVFAGYLGRGEGRLLLLIREDAASEVGWFLEYDGTSTECGGSRFFRKFFKFVGMVWVRDLCWGRGRGGSCSSLKKIFNVWGDKNFLF